MAATSFSFVPLWAASANMRWLSLKWARNYSTYVKTTGIIENEPQKDEPYRVSCRWQAILLVLVVNYTSLLSVFSTSQSMTGLWQQVLPKFHCQKLRNPCLKPAVVPPLFFREIPLFGTAALVFIPVIYYEYVPHFTLEQLIALRSHPYSEL